MNPLRVGDIIACVFNDADVLLLPPAPIALIAFLRGYRERERTWSPSI